MLNAYTRTHTHTFRACLSSKAVSLWQVLGQLRMYTGFVYERARNQGSLARAVLISSADVWDYRCCVRVCGVMCI